MRLARAVPGRRERVGELLARVDHWRCASRSSAGNTGSKEWHHFCVFGERVDLLLNLSLMDGVQTGIDPGGRVARLAVLARDADGWVGDVDRFEPRDVRLDAGSVEARLGETHLRLEGGAYGIDMRLADGSVRASLLLEPLVTPAITDHQPLGRGGTMRWLVVPLLRADGELWVRGRRHVLRSAPAYHDHDWGVFRWGEGFTWNWAVALPGDPRTPWVMAATQIGDERRAQRFANSFLLWRDDRLCRAIRGGGICTESRGLLRPRGRALRVPRIMTLASPGSAVDVPRRYEVRAEEAGDVVELAIDLEDFSQIAIPNDDAAWSTTLLSECCGRARAEGRVRGERVELDGPALLELVHVAR